MYSPELPYFYLNTNTRRYSAMSILYLNKSMAVKDQYHWIDKHTLHNCVEDDGSPNRLCKFDKSYISYD